MRFRLMLLLHKWTSDWYAKNVLIPTLDGEIKKLEAFAAEVDRLSVEERTIH